MKLISGRRNNSANNFFQVTQQSVNGQAISFGYDDDGLLTSAGELSLERDQQNGRVIKVSVGSLIEPLSFRRARDGNRLFYGFEREDGHPKAFSLIRIQE